MSDVISPTPNEVLQALLNAHGYAAQISKGRVVVQGHDAQMSGDVYVRSPLNPSHLQLDVRVHLGDGRTLVESCSGVGDSLPYAMGDGFDIFCRSSFPVLLQAFFKEARGDVLKDAAHDVESEQWQLPSGRFTAWIGNATFRGQLPVEGEELVSWFEPFANFIRQVRLNPRQSHWIRLYYAHHKGETMTCEVLLDNEPWEEVQHEMTDFPWPKGEAFYSARIFLALQPITL